MLRDITEKIGNVTLILDCCFSGRMVRRRSHDVKLVSKYRTTTEKHSIRKLAKRLRQDEKLRGERFIEGNPHAVLIAATAPNETAFEYRNPQGQTVGILTDTLADAMDKTFDKDVSWRTTLLRVREIVQSKSSDQGQLQNPQAEGPDIRSSFQPKKGCPG